MPKKYFWLNNLAILYGLCILDISFFFIDQRGLSDKHCLWPFFHLFFRKEEQLQNPEAVINSLKTFDKSIKKKPSSQKYIKVANSISEESEDELESDRTSEPKPDYEREDSNKSDEVFPPKPKPLEGKVRDSFIY